jgi:hypothetical protein
MAEAPQHFVAILRPPEIIPWIKEGGAPRTDLAAGRSLQPFELVAVDDQRLHTRVRFALHLEQYAFSDQVGHDPAGFCRRPSRCNRRGCAAG